MKTNEDLQKDVQDAIKWEPSLNAAEIGVIAKNGIITLSGTVDSYIKKTDAETAAKNVAGVKAVVEKIEIKFNGMGRKDDSEVANDIISALKWAWSVPTDKVEIKVEDGWVTLGGELEWNYQRDAVKKSIQNLHGVRGVTNHITIKSDASESLNKIEIERALSRNWSINSQHIHVNISNKTITLNGTVHSSYQKEEAGRIVWNAPGVWLVNNELVVDYNEEI